MSLIRPPHVPEIPGLPPHVQRMRAEGDELSANCDKLVAFTRTPAFVELNALDGQLLLAQYTAMQTYLRILSIRLARANDAHNGLVPQPATALDKIKPLDS